MGKIDFKLVDETDFPWLDFNYYDRVANEFQLEGFSLIGDIEWVGLSEILPKSFYRTMCSKDGTIIAEIYHQKYRGFEIFWRLIFGAWRHSFKGIQLTTEFSDGSFIYTVTGKDKEKEYLLTETMTKQIVHPKTPVREMIEIHKRKLKDEIVKNSNKGALTIRNFEKWSESLYRVKSYAEQITLDSENKTGIE